MAREYKVYCPQCNDTLSFERPKYIEDMEALIKFRSEIGHLVQLRKMDCYLEVKCAAGNVDIDWFHTHANCYGLEVIDEFGHTMSCLTYAISDGCPGCAANSPRLP